MSAFLWSSFWMLVSAPAAAKFWKSDKPILAGVWFATFVSASIGYAKWKFNA